MVDVALPANHTMNILILSPHTDDVELCCGGTVARWIAEGYHVRSVVLSRCDASTPEGFEVGSLVGECRAAHVALGIESQGFGPFPVRHFPQHRQAILDYLYTLNTAEGPFDVVLCPSSTDTHQDHRTLYEEAVRIFKHTTMLGYMAPWNVLTDTSRVFVALTEEHLARKRAALECYRSQRGRPYMDNGYMRSLARATGGRVGAAFAESFELIRGVL